MNVTNGKKKLFTLYNIYTKDREKICFALESSLKELRTTLELCKTFKPFRFVDSDHIKINPNFEEDILVEDIMNGGKNEICIINEENLNDYSKTLQPTIESLIQPIQSIQSYLESYINSGSKSGYYSLPFKNKTVTLFLDFTVPKEVWMRTCYKKGNCVYPTEGVEWSRELLDEFKLKDLGISRSLETISAEFSWILQNFSYNAAKIKSYLNYDYSVDEKSYFINFINGKAPTGENWHSGYKEGYLFYSDFFNTFGKWSTMATGEHNGFVNTNQNYNFRSGGDLHHEGEFIHSTCNAYKSKDHSITNLLKWDSIDSVVWFRIY